MLCCKTGPIGVWVSLQRGVQDLCLCEWDADAGENPRFGASCYFFFSAPRVRERVDD
jgi:hypothetical protein